MSFIDYYHSYLTCHINHNDDLSHLSYRSKALERAIFVKSTRFNKYLELLKDTRFYLFGSTYCLAMGLCYVPLDFLHDKMVKESGFTNKIAGHVIAYYGILNIIGRLTFGIIAQRFSKQSILINSMVMVGMATSIFGMGYSSRYEHFVFCTSMFSFISSSLPVLTPLIIVHMFGMEHLKICFGIILLFSGVTTLVVPPMIGWLKTFCGTYFYGFMITGSIFIFAGLLSSFLLCMKKEQNTRYEPLKREPDE